MFAKLRKLYMPEIKNQIKRPSTVAPAPQPPQKLFELPERRRSYSKFIFAILVLVFLGAVSYFAYSQYTKPSSAPVVQAPPEPEEKTIPEGTAFYLGHDEKNTETIVYKYSPNSSEPDEKIGTIPEKNIIVLGDYINPYTYVTSNTDGNKLQTLDATTAKLQPLFDLPAQAITRAVSVSADKKYLAYSRIYGSETETGHGELWLYNLETKEQKKLGEDFALALYQTMNVSAWRDNDKQLILKVWVADGAGYAGNIYTADVQTGKLEKVNEPDVLGQLSPNHDLILYDGCVTPDAAAQSAENGYERACASGAELFTYDFTTKQVKSVYHNLRYDTNANKSTLRTFMSYLWQDDKTIIAAVPGALLSIPLGSPEKTTEIFSYDRVDPAKFKDNFVYLEKANSGTIIFSREDNWYILDRISQKLVNLSVDARKETISTWLN